jgi:hypothetical protein
MAEIYSGIEGIEVPQFNWQDIPGTKAAENKYIEDCKKACKAHSPNCEEAGEVIKFPVADGQALYMVLSLEPNVELIHLALGDAWDFQYVHLLDATEIRKKIEQQKAIEKMFNTKN